MGIEITDCSEATAQADPACSQKGAVNIIGIETEDLIAGRLEVCDGTIWRAVYDDHWNEADAGLVCLERNFTREGN